MAVYASERRRQNRGKRSQFQPIKLTVGSGPDAADVPARLVDLTEEGLGIETGVPLAVGQEVRVSSPEGLHGRIGAHKARVRWCNPGRGGAFNCGLLFDDAGERQQAKERTVPKPAPEPDENFGDAYEIMQLSPNADLDTVHRIFRMLAQRYHPDNKETGSAEQFRQLLAAYQVLSDPEKRAAWDARRAVTNKTRWRIFDSPSAAVGLEAEKRKRQGVLSLLYMKRLSEPQQHMMTAQDFEEMLNCPREHLEFTLWYLKEAGLVLRTDNGRYAITLKGVDFAEELGLWCPSTARMLPAGKP